MSKRIGEATGKPATIYDLDELENATTTGQSDMAFDGESAALNDTLSDADREDIPAERNSVDLTDETSIDLDSLTYKQKLELGGELGVERIRRLQAEKAALDREAVSAGTGHVVADEAAKDKARFQARLEYGSSDLFRDERDDFVKRKLDEDSVTDETGGAENVPVVDSDSQTSAGESSGSVASENERRTALQELLFTPGSLAEWRRELAGEVALHGNSDEVNGEQIAADFLAGKLDPFEDSGLLTPALREQLMVFLAASEEEFGAYREEYDRINGIDPENLVNDTDDTPESHRYPISMRVHTYIKNRWNDLKDRFFGDGNENASRNKGIAWGIGAVAVATGVYAAWKYGYEAGYHDGMGELPEIDPDVVPEAEPDMPSTGSGNNEIADQDLSAGFGLPENYLVETSEGYVVTAMEGNQTDSIWRAAEHALHHYLEREPTTVEINNLQNMIGDHWLEVGERVDIPTSLIERSLSR